MIIILDNGMDYDDLSISFIAVPKRLYEKFEQEITHLVLHSLEYSTPYIVMLVKSADVLEPKDVMPLSRWLSPRDFVTENLKLNAKGKALPFGLLDYLITEWPKEGRGEVAYVSLLMHRNALKEGK